MLGNYAKNVVTTQHIPNLPESRQKNVVVRAILMTIYKNNKSLILL